jgi:hypothetical protein
MATPYFDLAKKFRYIGISYGDVLLYVDTLDNKPATPHHTNAVQRIAHQPFIRRAIEHAHRVEKRRRAAVQCEIARNVASGGDALGHCEHCGQGPCPFFEVRHHAHGH